MTETGSLGVAERADVIARELRESEPFPVVIEVLG
jgi:hypothetical protein